MPGAHDTTLTRTEALPSDEVFSFRGYRLEVAGRGGGPAVRVADAPRLVVGSSRECDLVVADPSVSRRHLEVSATERGYLARDLDSKNGTLVDGVPIVAAYLRPSSTLQIGSTVLRFEALADRVEIPLHPHDELGRLVGGSTEMRALFAALVRIASEDVTVLVEGESGTGKELIAEELHARSPRAGGPFVVVDCSAIPKDLIESELFGHVKGAFTGATADRPGAFRLADGGTLFLDEIGELPLELQPRLLRALESRTVRPVGGSQTYPCDVRVVSATNRSLADEVDAGSFREDLYYRLNVIRLRVPPLRRRREDIPLLVRRFLGQGAGAELPSDLMGLLHDHDWPGNVRELRNVVERFRLFGTRAAGAMGPLVDRRGAAGAGDSLPVDLDRPYKDAKAAMVEALEVEYFRRLLGRFKTLAEVAKAAGLHRKHVEDIVRKHGLR